MTVSVGDLFLRFTAIWAGVKGFLFCLFKFPKTFMFFVRFAVNKTPKSAKRNFYPFKSVNLLLL